MNTILRLWKRDGTKMLGTLQVIVTGLMAIEGLVPKDELKWWLAANVVLGALTIRRGYVNTKAE